MVMSGVSVISLHIPVAVVSSWHKILYDILMQFPINFLGFENKFPTFNNVLQMKNDSLPSVEVIY